MKYVFLVTEQISNNENWFLTDFFFFSMSKTSSLLNSLLERNVYEIVKFDNDVW